MNTPPVVTAFDQIALLNSSTSASSLFNFFDADGDPPVRYRFRDRTAGNNTGQFKLNGVAQGNGWVVVTPANLGDLVFEAGSSIGTDTVDILAYDGTQWSAFTSLTFYSVMANTTKPSVQLSNFGVVQNERRPVEPLISFNDPDGWPLERIRFRDLTVAAGTGFFLFKGQRMPENQWFTVVNPEDLSRLHYVAGSDQTETILTMARDGRPHQGGQWSDVFWSTATSLRNTSRPFVLPASTVLPKGASMPLENLIDVADADGNTIKRYRLRDTSPQANSAYLTVNGVRQAPQTWVTVSAKDLPNVRLTSADVFRTDEIRVRAFDGRHWSPVQGFLVDTQVQPKLGQSGPVVVEDSERINFMDVFEQIDSGPMFKSFEVYDSSSTHPNHLVDLTGKLVQDTSNFLAPNTLHTLNSVEMQSLIFEGGRFDDRALDEIYVRANNGQFNTRWERLTLRSEPEYIESHTGADPPFTNWKDFISGEPIVLTFSFAESFPDDGRGTGAGTEDNFVVVDPFGKEAIREEFLRWNQFQDTIIFQEVSDDSFDSTNGLEGGIIRIHGYVDPDDDACAFAFFPGSPSNPTPGDVWLNYGLCFAPGGWQDDGNQKLIFRHELGHVLGLKHSHPSPPTNFPVLPANLGSHDFSIMYTPGGRADGGFTRTFGLYGNAAIHELYGRGQMNEGDTRYDVNNYWEGDANFFDGIYDSGGTDTIAITDSVFDNIFDLRDGSFSSINGAENNLFIDFGVDIENVTAGRGADTIIGNDLDNVLVGGFGNDDIRSYGGNDIMIGNERHDTYRWFLGDGDDLIDERQGGGVDRLVLESFADLGLDNFTDDLRFRRLGRDLIIDFKLDDELITQGSIRIRNQRWGLSRVETLDAFGTDVDLRDVYNKTNAIDQKFVINFSAPQSAFGFQVAPV